MKKICILLICVGTIGVVVLAAGPKNKAASDYRNPLKRVFRILQSAPDSPSPAEKGLIKAALAPYGQGTQLLATHYVRAQHGDAWLLLTQRFLCLAQVPHGSANCVPTNAAIANGVVVGTFDPPTEHIPHMHNFRVHGVVPDGITDVSVLIGEHSALVPVRQNIFSIAADKPIHIKRLLRS